MSSASAEAAPSRVSIANLLGESAIYGLAKIVDPLIGFVLLPVISAILSRADYGFISFFTLVSTVFFTVVSLGVHQAFLRFFTESDDPAHRGRVAGTAIALTIAYWALVAPIGVYFARPLASLVFASADPTLIYILLTLALVETLDALGCNLLQASGRAWAFLTATVTNTVLVRAAAVALILSGGGAMGWIAGETAGRTIAMVVVLAIALPRLPVAADRSTARQLTWYGAALVPAMLSFYLMTITDKLVIRWAVSDWEEQIGLYAVGERIASIMHLTNMAIILAWQRFAFSNMHRDDGGGLIARGLRLYFVGAGLAAVGLIVLGDDLMRFMINDRFHAGIPVIAPLTAAALLGGLANLTDIGLHRRKLPHVISLVGGLSAAINVALNVYFVPRYGFVAAAWSTLVSQSIRLVVVFAVSQWAYTLPMDWGRIGVAAALYGVTIAVAILLDAWPIQTSIIAALPIILWLLPLWTPDERQTVRKHVRRLAARL